MRNFNEVKEHLDTLNSTQEKIAYLVECKNRNLQTNTDLFVEGYASPFDRKCQLEIEILKERLALESVETPQQPEPLDLSGTYAVEKIIYLNELGIIDFLRSKPEFMGSTNLMATVLSAITGEKIGTLQPSLNLLINGDKDADRHPYRSQKTFDKVRQTLINKNIKTKTS